MKWDISPAAWQFLSLALLISLIASAVVLDVRRQRIPNKLVLVVLAAGFLTHLLGPANEGGGLFSYWPGALGGKGAFLGVLMGLSLFLPLYAMGATGAGDVKLMAGIGAFMGPADTLAVGLVIFAIGGMLAVARMVWTGASRRVLGNLMLMLLPVFHGGPRVFDPRTQSADRMPYVLAIACGLLAYGAWRWFGGQPLFRF